MSMVEVVKVRSVDGRGSIVITLPKRIAREVGIAQNDHVTLTSTSDGTVIITKEKAQ